jgi:hypothetical protein
MEGPYYGIVHGGVSKHVVEGAYDYSFAMFIVTLSVAVVHNLTATIA